MRPEILYPLFAPLTAIDGIGARYAKLYEGLMGGDKVVDLLFHLPYSLINRGEIKPLSAAKAGEVGTFAVEVTDHLRPHTRSRKAPTKVICKDISSRAKDDISAITLVFFKSYPSLLTNLLPIGAKVVISGKPELFDYSLHMNHPDYIVPLARADEIPAREPVYPLTAGLSQKMLGKSIRTALARIPTLPEWQDKDFVAREGFPAWQTALTSAHSPAALADLSPTSPIRRRLAYDELLADQLALALIRAHTKGQRGHSIKGDGHLTAQVLKALPFTLTAAQTRILGEIKKDMSAPHPMLRLIEGDVGSGKTIIAFLAFLNAIEGGYQGAFMTPTDILTRQHYAKFKPIADSLGLKIALITGKDTARERKTTLEGLALGDISLVIGTHALIEDKVAFRALGLVVIDEQHKFGVHQRLRLTSKNSAVDVLVMTATPIPRTLALTMYGDMDISVVDEKPKGRKPIKTVAIPYTQKPEVIAAIGRAIAQGHKVYWVCPLVEESETLDLAAATSRYEELRKTFGDRVGLVHGKMKSAEKEEIMTRFAQARANLNPSEDKSQENPLDILVATTVIEVGIDVPAATVMVIDHAERFGLSGLHQLRGRIGRGAEESSCILLYGGRLTATAKARLDIMRTTEDGFTIAEEDLRLRGTGEVLGTKQSGFPEFRLADLSAHLDLMRIASDDTKLILSTDPDLSTPRGRALRTLLYLFSHDEKVKLLKG